MERIINYDELPSVRGQSIYLRMETDPQLYIALLSKGYKVVNNIFDADNSTIYVTRRRQSIGVSSDEEYVERLDNRIQRLLSKGNIEKPTSYNFNYQDLIEHKYKVPFVLKNENLNCGREKFLIATEEDYENLIKAYSALLDKVLLGVYGMVTDDDRFKIDYEEYFNSNFIIQEYIETPSEYNTTLRLLTTPTDSLLYASLKYNKPEEYVDNTSLLGYLLSEVYPLSTSSIVSNTAHGGENIILGESEYQPYETRLLKEHNIDSDQFEELVSISQDVHQTCHSELGIICGFDYIYDRERSKWYLLEYHTRPMVRDYSSRQGISCTTKESIINAEGRVRATALSLVLKKTR